MIFSVIGENFGFIGGCILIFIYLLLIFQMIQVTFDTRNEFYAYISTGVFAWCEKRVIKFTEIKLDSCEILLNRL